MTTPLTQSSQIDSHATFKYNFRCWRISGVHPTKRYRKLYIIYSIFINTFITLLYPVTLLTRVLLSENIKEALNALNLTAADVACGCKQLNVFLKRKNILAITDLVAKLDSRAKQADEQRILGRTIKTMQGFFKVFFVTYMSTVLLSEIATVFASPRRLMYPAWFPFDWQASNVNYLIVHIYQFVGLAIGTLEQCTNDTFPAIYMGVLKAHVQTLRIRIKRIGFNAGKSAKANYKDLIECVQDYHLLRQYFSLVQNITSNVLLIQFFVTGLAACITAVYVFFLKGSNIEIVYLVCYFVCVVMEILISCYCGNQLLHESQLVTTAIYSCNWTDQSPGFKKVMIIFMELTKQDMSIMAGGMIKVNLSSFMSLIRTSYSLFAVLMQVT